MKHYLMVMVTNCNSELPLAITSVRMSRRPIQGAGQVPPLKSSSLTGVALLQAYQMHCVGLYSIILYSFFSRVFVIFFAVTVVFTLYERPTCTYKMMYIPANK